MARKKPTRSRVQKYKAQRRKSWFQFLTKLALFFVPIVAFSIWLILFMLPAGSELPILVLDLDSKETKKEERSWQRISYGATDTDEGIHIPDSIKFGGPKKNVLFVFNDLLGSARKLESSDRLEACVFVPNTPSEHLTHRFRGLVNLESIEEQAQWQPFEQYVFELIKEIKSIRDAQGENGTAHVVLALDIDHPDLPGRRPPQADSFIELCKRQWEAPQLGLRAELAKLDPDLNVHIWLSHSAGQISYYDSDFAQVESFFKRRFERGITGDVIEVAETSKRDVYYSDLKKYVDQWVQTDAEVHKLAQNPVFLEPNGFEDPETSQDFPILRKKYLQRRENGNLFRYASRRNDPDYQLDQNWERLQQVKQDKHWTIENPLLLQQSTMLLLQMEKLWYVGLADSELFDQLRREVESNFNATTTILPVKHSLHDALAQEPHTTIFDFDLSLATPTEITAPDGETLDDDQRKSLQEKAEKQRQLEIGRWRNANLSWNRPFSVWKTISNLEKNGIDRDTIQGALELIDEQDRYVRRDEGLTEVADLTEVYWNEIGYLERLAHELTWPDESSEQFEELVLKSIKARDRFNRLAANIAPSLVEKFQAPIESLENRRRQLEDRLFANDHAELRDQYASLEDERIAIEGKYNRLKTDFETLQKQLIAAPHDFRYCLESVSVPLRETAMQGKQQLVKFAQWNASDIGFVENWRKLGNHEIGRLIQRSDNDDEIKILEDRTNAFDSIRRRWHESVDTAEFATTPYQDFEKYKQNPDTLDAADGNLLGRRLMASPSLELEARKTIRAGLCKEKVMRSGGIQQFETPNSEFAEEFLKFVDSTQIRDLTHLDSNALPIQSGNENYFTQVAFEAHLLRGSPFKETALNLTFAINDFRCRKSNFDLSRVAGDLWGTPKKRNEESFVTRAVTNHIELVEARIRTFPDRLHATRDELTEVWNAGPKKDWPDRLSEIQEFSTRFPSVHWRWDRKQQKAINNDLAPAIERESPNETPLVFAISTDNKKPGSIFSRKFSESDQWIDPDPINGDSLQIYLRGHTASLGIQRAIVPIAPVRFNVDQNSYNVPGAKLAVKRISTGPASGHITIVIDCSESMSIQQRMKDAIDNVNQFLDYIKGRADISITLIAIGAGEKFSKNGWKTRSPQLLSNWRKQANSDVWFYSENEKVINEVVDKRTVDKFKAAVMELDHFGDTPILAGLDAAINGTSYDEDIPKLIVLLTDGFEYGHRKDRAPDELFAKFDTQLYERIGRQLKSEGHELVVFSFLANPIRDEFSHMLPKDDGNEKRPGIELEKIKNRIDRIEKLATIHRRAKDTTLQRFFEELLPQPSVIVKDEGNSRTITERMVVKGKDLNRDGQLSDQELKIMQSFSLAAQERPDVWSVGVQFNQQAKDNAARSFSRTPTAWRSKTKVAGNEKLEFEFNPLLSSLELTTDSGFLADPQTIEMGATRLAVGSLGNSSRKPGFQLATMSKKELTPAPALAFLTLVPRSAGNDDSQALLIQDYNLKQQTRSNVHPIEFPLIRDEVREARFQRQPLVQNLHLISAFTPQFWTRIEFNLADDMQIRNEQRQLKKIKQGEYIDIKDLLPAELPFQKYSFQLKRDNQPDVVRYTTYISGKDANVPLDRWLVQVLNEQGEIDRRINQRTRRTYVFQPDAQGNKRLIGIEHHFSIIKSEIKDSVASFGFANIDHLEDAKVGILEIRKE